MFSSSPSENLDPLQMQLEDIRKATDKFSDANLIRETRSRKSYKGEIMLSGQKTVIVAERQKGITFFEEISILSSLKHRNVVSLVGYCYDRKSGDKIIIYKHNQAKGSLDRNLTDSDLTWMRRLDICVGVAHALSYIYYEEGRDFSIIHRDISSSNILLSENWKPKLSGFKFSMKHPAVRRDSLFPVAFSAMRGYERAYASSVSHKSDMYAFGVVLCEVLCGKTAANNKLLASVKAHYKEGTLHDIIFPGLLEQMDHQSLRIFTEVAYKCLEEQQSQRPDILQILKKLSKAADTQWEHDALKNEAGTSKRLEERNLKHLEIPLTHILSATKDFDKARQIGKGSFGKVYEAELVLNDRMPPGEENNIGELPKKRTRVAIKRILDREDADGRDGFYKEIEMLSDCHHPNIVSLLGFCKERDHMILVYEYASKQSLDNYLIGSGNLTNLSWVQRLEICIGIANGLKYLHNRDTQRIIHRDIKSGNILLDENWVAKIGDFGLSKLRPEVNQQVNETLYTNNHVGTRVYMAPEYFETGKMKNESDIYSFGVVLLEMLSGTFANAPIYTKKDSSGIAAVARRLSKEGIVKKMVDPRLSEEAHENLFARNTAPAQKSLDVFIDIAYLCVSKTPAERPCAKVIINKLGEALTLQKNHRDRLQMKIKDIRRATDEFTKVIRIETSGKVYKGKVCHADGQVDFITAKRMAHLSRKGDEEIWKELQILLDYEHENIIGIYGYCIDEQNKIIVYEDASRESLDKCLKDNDLTWTKRLAICKGIASALEFLQGGDARKQEVVVHRRIRCCNILLSNDWIAKLTDFGFCYTRPISKNMEYRSDIVSGSLRHLDPDKESDIYSFGGVLFSILSGRSLYEASEIEERRYLINLVRDLNKRGELDQIVFEGIKNDIAPKSLATFQSIALKCIQDKEVDRPTTTDLLAQITEALELQKDHDDWKHKLPQDCEEIFKKSYSPLYSPEVYCTTKYKQLHDMLSEGILLDKGKVLFSLGANKERNVMISVEKLFLLGANGERNVMIPAKNSSSIHRCLYKRQYVPESRFQVVVEMLDILNLNLQIKPRTQLLTLNDKYGVYLVFKFCNPRKYSTEPLYVNLKYKYGTPSETLNAYFATRRDNDRMMIELWRFLNDREDISFEFQLESFSPYYYGENAIYVEGIEFRPVTNASLKNTMGGHEKNKELKKYDTIMDMFQQVSTKVEVRDEDACVKFWSVEENGKKHLMLSAKEALDNYSNVTLYKTKPSPQYRFQEAIEFLPQQVFCISCKIRSEMLSRDTDYVCYLVFKLSDECHGLDYPIRVRDLLNWSDEVDEILYFSSPRPWNLHDPNQAPKQRVDRLMDVKVWKFHLNQEFKDEYFLVNLRLVCYKGTLSGLIVCGLEFRPM